MFFPSPQPLAPFLPLPPADPPRNSRQIGHHFDFRPLLTQQGEHFLAHIVANLYHHEAAGLKHFEGLREQASIDFVAALKVATPSDARLKLPHLPLHHFDVPLPDIGWVRNDKIECTQKVLIEKSSQEVALEELNAFRHSQANCVSRGHHQSRPGDVCAEEDGPGKLGSERQSNAPGACPYVHDAHPSFFRQSAPAREFKHSL